MKLINMTAFVLEQNKKRGGVYEFAGIVFNYANFLKQPLKLEMFVPCDDEGNALKEPDFRYETDSINGGMKTSDDYVQYQQAKEKVLFEGCEYNQGEIYTIDEVIFFNVKMEFKNLTIESLVEEGITLTETAIKQIGL